MSSTQIALAAVLLCSGLTIAGQSAYAQIEPLSAPTRPSNTPSLAAPTRPNSPKKTFTLQGILKASPHVFHIKPDYDYELRSPDSQTRLAWLVMEGSTSLQPLSTYIGKKVQIQGINVAQPSNPCLILKVER
ncbi:MAG TPA: hypothetical protein PLV25_03245, partial [Opitutales bacterium]|nr:hypothetical protein [Opitutales bacterium]